MSEERSFNILLHRDKLLENRFESSLFPLFSQKTEVPQVYPFTVLENLPAQRAFELETVFLLYPATGQVAHKGTGGYHGSPQVFEAEVTHQGQCFRCIALAPVGHAQPVTDLELVRVARYAGVSRADEDSGTLLFLDGERVLFAIPYLLRPARAVGLDQLAAGLWSDSAQPL